MCCTSKFPRPHATSARRLPQQQSNSSHCDLFPFAEAFGIAYVTISKFCIRPPPPCCPQSSKTRTPTHICAQQQLHRILDSTRQCTRHRQAGRPILRRPQHCIGCDSPQTAFRRPTPLFYASRGPGTLSIQACEVSRVSTAPIQTTAPRVTLSP